MTSYALELGGIRRSFAQAGQRIEVLRGIDLQVEAGAAIGLIGVSGAGKSTLLHIAGLLEKPNAGDVRIAGEAAPVRRDRARTRLRREAIGFVYQFHHLLSEFTALENVMLPLLIAGRPRREALDRAGELLAQVGLEERVSHHPAKLSGGEQQRVAVARALANQPRLVLADEPTGNLDEETAERVFDAFVAALRARSASAVIATHDRRLARRLDRVYALEHGVLTPVASEEVSA